MSDLPLLNLAPGVHENISERDYHADLLCEVPTLSCSLAKTLINQSPLHAFCEHPRLGNLVKDEPTAERELASAMHQMCLGKGAEIAICEEKNWQKKAAQEFREAAREAGRLPVLRHRHSELLSQRDELFRQLGEFGLLEMYAAAKPEVVLIYDDGPMRCRAMLDKLFIDETTKKATIFDIKNIDSANPRALGRLVFNQSYDMQNFSYVEGLAKLRPDLAGRIDFLFLFSEISIPYCLTPYRLNGEQVRMQGLSKWTRAWQMWEACTKAGKWPAYTKEIVTGEPPEYAISAEVAANPILP